MDKRKYLTKTLIAEYSGGSKVEGCRFKEFAYILKNGSIAIEYDGEEYSIYGVKISFSKSIGRKGIYEISREEYEAWKVRRKNDEDGYFMDWEEMQEEQFDEIFNTMFSVYDDNNILQLVIDDKDLPF